MAKLPDEIIATVLNLERDLLERLNEATATELELLEQYGENESTLNEFEQLQNAKERVDSYYTRFYVTLKRIYSSQPVATRDSLELLAHYINEAEATAAATAATVQEIRKDFNLP